jgi:hypothetical protein
MAKKPSAARRGTPRKTPARQKSISLVEPPQTSKPAQPQAATGTGTNKVTKQPAIATLTSPEAPTAKPAPADQQGKTAATPGQSTPATRNPTKPESEARLPARSRANLISAENYRYVLNDLRLIAMLAIFLFSIIIVLHFVLPQ